MNHKILVVDDEPANLRLLERLFRTHYQVITASSGMEALELLGQYDVAVIISDQRMPGMTGIEFLKRAAGMRFHTVRIILTGYTDVGALVEAINSGVVYKYVSKPWSNEDLLQTVARALEHHETNKRQYELTLYNDRISARLKAQRRGFVRLLAEMLDIKDETAHNHARRTAGYAVAVGSRLNLEPEDIEQLELAAYLHEVGNIAVPDALLRRIPDLTAEETALVERRRERGVSMLGTAPEWSETALAARHCPEHYGGGGLPDNLSAEQIPLFSRVVAVACAYDEMTAPRRAVFALTHDEALDELEKNSGERFDPELVGIFGEIKAIGRIRQTISDGATGVRLLPSRIFTDTKSLSTAELLQKFKTEPMLALDVLKSANAAGGEKTTGLMAAMSGLGEARLRQLVEHNGLPAADAKLDSWAQRAARRAVVAQLLAAQTKFVEPDEAYTLGLLYDAGDILLANLFPEEMLALDKIEDETTRRRRQVETFGLDSVQISRLMLEAVGFSPRQTAAVRIYNELMHVNNPVTLLLHAAFKIAGENELNKPTGEVIDDDYFGALNLTRAGLYQIYERANAISVNRAEVFQESRAPAFD